MIAAAARGLLAAFLVAMVAFLLQLERSVLNEWTSFFAALPIFGGALAQSGAVYLELAVEDRNIPAFGALFVLVPFAAFGGIDIGGGTSAALFVGGAVVVMSAFGMLAGALLRVLPRFAFVAACGTTAIALVVAALVPSIPTARNPLIRRPDASYVKDLPVAGDLRVEGAPIVVHGYRYRQRHEGEWRGCEIVVEDEHTTTNLVHTSCEMTRLYCDEMRAWCIVDQEGSAAGMTFSGEQFWLYRDRRPLERGEIPIRVGAEMLALLAAFLLYRGRASPLRALFATSGLISSSIAISFVLRIFIARA